MKTLKTIDRVGLTALAVFTTQACVQRTHNEARVQHEAGALTWDSDAWEFAPETPRPTITMGVVQDLSSPRSQVAMAIVTQMDRSMRRLYPRALDRVPPPKAYVNNLWGLNAYAPRPIPGCLKVPVVFGEPLPQGVRPDPKPNSFLAPERKELGIKDAPCTFVAPGLEDLVRLVSWINRGSWHASHMAFSMEPAQGRCAAELLSAQGVPYILLRPGEDCQRTGSTANPSTVYEGIAYQASDQWIIVQEQAFRLDNVSTFAALLAHELGHYYRGHVARGYRSVYCYRSCQYTAAGAPPACTETDCNQPGLDWYGYEQEADDLGLEILLSTGAEPQAFVSMLTQLLRAEPACLKIRSQGWKNDDGSPFLPEHRRGSGAYQSACYRLWNADQEIAKQGWMRNPRAEPLVLPFPWEQVRIVPER